MTGIPATGVGVEFRGVSKSFGEVQALRPVDLVIQSGEFLTLLGPSGSGKTTLLNIAAGYLDPDQGRILIGGRDVTSIPPRQRNIGMVFQNYALFPHMDVRENIAYGLRVRKVREPELNQRIQAAIEMVQLQGLEKRPVQQLSGGQQQRVALARAMIIAPDLLLMDEPLGALDRQLRKHVQLEIRRLHTASPRTTLYVTHDQEEALVMSDRVAIMRHGQLEQVGTPRELYEAPRNAFIATFLGESNLIPVRIVDRTAGQVTFTIDGYNGSWVISHQEVVPPPGPALLLARPEGIEPAGDGEAALKGTIEENVYLGELTATRLRLRSGQQIWMRRMNAPAQSVGTEMRVNWNPAHSRLLPDDGEY